MAGHQLLDVLSEVVPQVPTVGDLHGQRSTLTGAVGIGAGAVAAHDLDAGVLTQPVGDVPASRSASNSTGRSLSMSTRTLP
jgi:hypothetical protein